jgi:hypothetical protein
MPKKTPLAVSVPLSLTNDDLQALAWLVAKGHALNRSEATRKAIYSLCQHHRYPRLAAMALSSPEARERVLVQDAT